MNLTWAPRALQDVDKLLDYIRGSSPIGARNVAIAINRAAAHCALHPYTGARTKQRNLFRAPLAKRRITIFYRVDSGRDVVEIVRVVRSGRVKNLGRLPRS